MLTLLLLGSSLTLLASTPSAAAWNGDLIVTPGNPCGAQGSSGGVAVDEVAKRLYYSSRSSNKIHNVSTVTLTGCSMISPTVNPTWGWTSLAFTRTHPTARFWVANNETVYGLTWSGAVATSHTFPQRVDHLEVDEANGNLLLTFENDPTLRRYSSSFVPLSTLATSAYAGVASWQGGFLVSDGGSYVRLVDPSGVYAQFGFRPGYNWTDEFFQTYRATFSHDETAFDETTYTGRGALYLSTTNTQTVCVANCPVIDCIQWENGTCIRWGCIANCSGGTYVTTQAPYLRVVEVFRPCPNGPVYQPCGPNPCTTAPLPNVAFVRPTPGTYLRGTQVSNSGPVVVVDGPITVELTDPNGLAQKQLDLSWTGGGSATTVGQNLVVTLSTNGWARGMHTIVGTVRDTLGCRIVATAIKIFVEDPVLATRAQNVRVEGNLPLHVVAGTLAISPADALIGRETYEVLDRDLGSGLGFASALTATAQHDAWPGIVQAQAYTEASMAQASLDLVALCDALTGDPACAALPPTYATAREQALTSGAVAVAYLVDGTSYGWGGADGAIGDARAVTLGESAAAYAHLTLQGDLDAFAYSSPTGPVWHTEPGSIGPIAAGPMTVTFNELRTRSGPLFAEVVATAIRITIDDGTLQGEIVLGESYAAASLAGPAVLEGAPHMPLDDYATGADTPVSPAAADAPVLAPGLYAGAFADADRIDAFRVAAAPGDKLRVVVSHAHQVGAFASPVPTAPNLLVAPRLARVTLMDPLGVARDVSTLAPLDAQPGAVELNVDLAGEWGIVVERLDARDERAPYAVAIDLSAAVLPPDEGAANACAGAMALPGHGAAVGALDATDAADVFGFVRTSARPLALTLTPLDPEGADLRVTLLDASCAPYASGTALGPAKGAPEVLALTSLPAGTWHVKVERVNGIGGYTLTTG